MRRSRASAWARDPDSVYAKGIYPRGTFYTGSTKRSSTGASTRIANSDYSLMLDEDGAAKLLGATADADDDVVVQYIPFRRTRSTGNRGSFCFFSSDEIARDTFPLSERNVASADRKRSTSTMRIPVDRIPQPASNQSLLSGRRTNTRNQSISVTVRPEWDEDKTVAYVESENTARCHPRRTVAQQVSIPLTQDGFTDTDNENDQIMYVPVRRSTARQLRFCSVPVAPPSRRSAMERRSVRPYASEMTSAVRCPTPSRRNYGGSEASLGEDSPVLIHAALRGTTDGYMDDEDCSFDHKRMRQRAAGKRFGYNPDSLPSCRLSAVAPGGSKPVGVVRIPPGARQRTGFARRSTRIAATKVRPSTNLVVLERRPRPVSRDEVGDSEKYEPVDVSMSSTASSTELYEAGREPSYSSSRRFVGELDYDEMPIPFVYMPVSDSSLCDTNTARRTSLRPPPGTGGATGGKYASARAVAGQRRSDTRVRGAFFSARGPSASTPDDTDIESGNGEPVDYSPGVNTSGGSFGVSLQKRPSNSTLTGVAALSMADIPLVAAEGSNMMGRRVHPNRVASTLTAQLDHLMLTGRSEDLDERPASQAPRRSVHTQVSDEHEDGIVLVPVRRSVARGEGKEQTKFQAVSRIQDKDEDSWEHENKKASTVQQGFAPVPPQCISNAPAETSVASRKPSGSANTRRKSSVPAVVNDASIIIGSGSVLRQGCYEPDQEWQDTGVVASTSQLKGDAETATARPRGAFRKSSCERARSVVPLASQAKKKVELFDDAKHLTSDVRSLSKGALGRTLQASKRPELLRQNASSRYSSRQSSLPVAAGQNDGVQHRSSERDVREGRGVPLSAAPVGEPPRSHRRQLQRGDELSDDNAHFDHGESSVEKRRCQTGLGGRRSTRLQGSAAAVRAATGRSIAAVEDTKESEAPDVETGVERGEYPEEVSALASCRSVRHSNKGRGRVTMGVSPATDQYILRSSQVYGCRKTMRFAADGNGDEYEESRRKAASWAATPRDSFGGKRSVQENLFTDSDQEEECDGEEGNQTSDNADDFAGGEIASTYDASDSIQAAQEDENGTILVPLRSTRRQTNSSTPRRMSTRVRESESNPSTRKTSSGCCCGFMCCCGPEVLADTPGDSPDMSLATPPQPKDAREKQPKDPLRISITQKRCGQNDVTGEASHNLVTSTRRATLQLPFVTAPRNVCMNTTPAMQRPRRTVERGSLQPTNAVNLRTSVTDRSSSSTEERDAYEDDDAIEGNGSIVDEAEETSVDACAMQPLTTPPAAESPLPVPHTRSAATSPIPPTEELTSRMLSSTSTADQQSSCSSLTRSSQLSRSAPQVTVQVRGTVPPTPPRSPYPVVTQGCSSALPQASSSCPPVGLLNISEHIVAHSSAAKSLNTGRDMDGTPERNQQTRSIPGNCHFGGEGTHRPSQYRSSPPPSAMTAQWKTASVSEAPFSVTEALDSRVTCDAAGKHQHTHIEKELEIQEEGCCVRIGAPLPLSAEAVPNKARDATDFFGTPPLRASVCPSLVERELREGHTSSSLLSREVEGFNQVSLAIPANPFPTTQKAEREEMRSWFCSATIGRAAFSYAPKSHHSSLYSRLPRKFPVFRSSGGLSHRSTALSGAGTATEPSTSCGIESRFHLSRGQGDRLSSCHQGVNVFPHARTSRTLVSRDTWDSVGLCQREEDSRRNSGSECDAPNGNATTDGGSTTHADGRVQHARLQSAQKWESCNSGHTSAEAVATQAAAASFYASSLAKGGFSGEACFFPCSPSPPSSDGRSGTATLVDAWSREGHTENCPYCRPPCGRESVERNRRKPVSGCDEGRTDSSAAATSNRRVIGVSGAATQTKESTGSVDEWGKTECQWGAWWNPRKSCGTARILARCTRSVSPPTRCLGETCSHVQRPDSPVSRTASMAFSLGRKSDTSLTQEIRFLLDAPKCVSKYGERFSTSSGQSGTSSALSSHWSLDTRESLCTSLSVLSIPSLPNSFCVSDEGNRDKRQNVKWWP